MSDYTKTVDFAIKDSLPTGNANKVVKGTEIDTEFNNIATAIATKSNTASPTFTGTVTIPTADINAGAIDGTAIGASSASTGAFTTLTASGATTLNGNTTIGNASGDSLDFHPAAWTLNNAVSVTGTWTDLGTVTTVDINGGTVGGVTLDGTISGTPTWASTQAVNISGTAPAGTLTGTTLAANVVSSSLTSLGTITSLVATTADINGGTGDNFVLGANTPAAATVTAFTSNGIDDNATATVLLLGDSEVVSLQPVRVGTESATFPHGITGFYATNSVNGAELVLKNTGGLSSGEFVGGVAFGHDDPTGGVGPHYSGIIARSINTSGTMNLEFYTGLSAYEAGTSPTLKLLSDDSAEFAGNVLVGTTTYRGASGVSLGADGKLFASAGSPGAVSSVTNTVAVFENSTTNWIHLRAPDASSMGFLFGSPSDNIGAQILWNHDNSALRMGTANVGSALQLEGDNAVPNLTLSGASGSERTQIAKTLDVNGGGSEETLNVGGGVFIDAGASSFNRSGMILDYAGGIARLAAGPSSTGIFALHVAGSEGLRMDSSRNLLISKTTAGSLSTAGIELQASGQVLMTAAGAEVLYLNRKTSDGKVLRIFKDGTEIGYLGTNATAFDIKSTSAGAVVFNRDVNAPVQIYRETATAAEQVLGFYTNVGGTDTRVASVFADGDIENVNNSYGALSDIKLKTDIQPATSQIEDVRKLAKIVSKFRLKNNTEGPLQIGWIAQEVQKVSPGLVKENPDLERVAIEKTRIVEKPVIETETIEKTVIEVVDGKAVQKKVTEEVEHEVFDEFPVFHANGKPVMHVIQEAKDAVYDEDENIIEEAQEEIIEQTIHRVPRTEEVEETYTDYEEQQIVDPDTGEPSVTLSIRHSVAMMKLFKAFGELDDEIQARLAALEAKA